MSESQRDSHFFWVGILLMILLMLYMLIIIFMQFQIFKKRYYFPIQERSPYLLIFGLGCLFLMIYSPTSILVLYNITDQYNRDKLNSLYVSTIYFNFFFLFSDFIRLFRLTYAINIKKTSKLMVNFLKSELIICLSLTIFLIFGYLLLIFFCRKMLFHDDKNHFQVDDITIIRIFELLWAFEAIVFQFFTFLTRRLKSEYSITSECMIQCLNQVLLINVIQMIKFLHNQNAITANWCLLFAIIQFFPTYSYFSVVRPLLNTSNYHYQLAQVLILDQFKTFTKENICVKAFYGFLTNLDEKQQSNYNVQAFSFYLSCITQYDKNQTLSQDFAYSTIQEYKELFIHLKNQELFESAYLERENSDNNKSSQILTLLINNYFLMAEEFLSQIYYQSFQLTRSFQTLTRQFKLNETILMNLYQLKMITLKIPTKTLSNSYVADIL